LAADEATPSNVTLACLPFCPGLVPFSGGKKQFSVTLQRGADYIFTAVRPHLPSYFHFLRQQFKYGYLVTMFHVLCKNGTSDSPCMAFKHRAHFLIILRHTDVEYESINYNPISIKCHGVTK
jgi:hypothetical protein